MHPHHPARTQRKLHGFTLVELLVVIAIVAALAAVTTGVVRNMTRKAKVVLCASKMKNLGSAIALYTQDHQGRFPRSFHSAGANGEPGWAVSVAAYMGFSDDDIEKSWQNIFNSHYRSPVDKSTDIFVYSYALNVHFELDPNGDDYTGAPQTWRSMQQVRYPSKTILMAQPKPIRFGDHLMCHQWSGIQAARNALNHEIHGGKANYLFVDGHVETIYVQDTLDPAKKLNRWNPSLAR